MWSVVIFPEHSELESPLPLSPDARPDVRRPATPFEVHTVASLISLDSSKVSKGLHFSSLYPSGTVSSSSGRGVVRQIFRKEQGPYFPIQLCSFLGNTPGASLPPAALYA